MQYLVARWKSRQAKSIDLVVLIDLVPFRAKGARLIIFLKKSIPSNFHFLDYHQTSPIFLGIDFWEYVIKMQYERIYSEKKIYCNNTALVFWKKDKFFLLQYEFPILSSGYLELLNLSTEKWFHTLPIGILHWSISILNYEYCVSCINGKDVKNLKSFWGLTLLRTTFHTMPNWV